MILVNQRDELDSFVAVRCDAVSVVEHLHELDGLHAVEVVLLLNQRLMLGDTVEWFIDESLDETLRQSAASCDCVEPSPPKTPSKAYLALKLLRIAALNFMS